MKAAVIFENGGPDVLRYEDVPDPERSGIFWTLNAGKLGCAINLTKLESLDIVYDLVRWADVVTESFALCSSISGRGAIWATTSSARKSYMLCAVSAGNSMIDWVFRLWRRCSGIGTMS